MKLPGAVVRSQDLDGGEQPGTELLEEDDLGLARGGVRIAARPRSMPSSIWNRGSANRMSSATPGTAIHGWAMTVRAHLAQPLTLALGVLLFVPPAATALGSAHLLTRSPSAASTAGSSVHAVNSVHSTTSTAPSAIPWNSGDFTMNSENSEIITIEPENRMVRPLVLIATPTAVATGRPCLVPGVHELLLEAAQDEQRVVDRDAYADHRDDARAGTSPSA